MSIPDLELTDLNLLCTSFGLFFVIYGSFSYLVKERFFLNEAPIAVLVGVALGPYGVGGIFNWASKEVEMDAVSLGLSRVVIGIQLTLVGIQLPYKYPQVELRSLSMLLLPVMTIMWLSTTLCIWLLIPRLSVLAALIIATSATPTDPVLSNAIVKGAFADQYVSPRLRNLISAESGGNDGFGYPFLYLAVHLIKETTTKEALTTWVFSTVLYKVLGAVLYGTLVGYVSRKALEFSTDRNLIDKESFLLYGSAMGVFIIGSGGALGFDELLAAFTAGNALTWNDFYRDQCEESEVDNCVDLLLNLVFFSFLGATIPWDSFNDPENGVTPLRLVGICVLVLLFRRLPAMLALYRFVPTLHDVSEASFMGYFAPIGAGAVYYLGEIMKEFKADDPSPYAQRIRVLAKPITYSLIIASIFGHSLAIPLVKLVFKWRGIESIKIKGESYAGSDISDDGGYHEHAEEDSDSLEEEYEEGEHVDPRPSKRNDRPSFQSGAGSYQQSSVHRASDNDTTLPVIDTTRHDGGAAQEQEHSWQVSSGHKLGPHHRLRRNEETGQVELDPHLYTLHQGNVVRMDQQSQKAHRRRNQGRGQQDEEQGLLQSGGNHYGST